MRSQLALYDALLEARVSVQTARNVAAALEADMNSVLATKADLEHLHLTLKGDMAEQRHILELQIQALGGTLRTEFSADSRSLGDGLRQDMQALCTELKQDMQELRTELKQDMQDLLTELKQDMQDLRTELKQDMQELRTEFKQDLQVLKVELIGVIDSKEALREQREAARDLKLLYRMAAVFGGLFTLFGAVAVAVQRFVPLA